MTRTEAGGNRFERHPVATLLVIIGVSVTSCDLLVTSLRNWYLRDACARQERSIRVASPRLHHALRPGHSASPVCWGGRTYAMHTNSLGLRDASPRRIEPRADQPVLLFLGDSFTEGVGVDYPDTFVGLVDRALSPGRLVLNGGVVSYSPILYLESARRLLVEVGLPVERILVFIDISDIQDEALAYERDPSGNVVYQEALRHLDPAQRFEPSSSPASPLRAVINFTMSHTTLVRLALLSVWDRTGKRFHAERPRAMWTIDDDLYKQWGQRGLETAGRHMHELAELARAREIPLTVAVYPWPEQILHGDLDSRQVRFWRSWAQEHGADFLDLFPTFMEGRSGPDCLQSFFIRGDVHWNEAAHRLVAEHVLQYLRSRMDLPPGVI